MKRRISMEENKQKILNALLPALKLTRAGKDIISLELATQDDREFVLITWDLPLSIIEGRVNVTGDSGAAMIADVMKRVTGS